MGDRLQRITKDLLDRAESAVAGSDWSAVRVFTEDALALDPRSDEAQALRALALRHLDEPKREAGRRQVTMLFADLVGSTPMSSRLDPEIYARLIRRYQRACRGAVEAYGGRVHEEQGDGFVAVFGYPTGQGDDAQRALAAALKIVTDVQAASSAIGEDDERLDVRVGVHTGLAVVAADGLYGETSNIAARIQAKAQTGVVMASGATAALAGDLFELTPAGATELRGIAEPVDLFIVSSVSPQVRVLEDSRIRPMVGRAVEYQGLKEALASVSPGTPGTMVLVQGEPGIGKSRLVEELRQHVETNDDQVLLMPASNLDSAVALHPIIRGLASQLELTRSVDSADAVERLRQLLELHELGSDENVALLAAMFGFEAEVEAPELDPSQVRERRLNLLYQVLQGATDARTLLLIEDLHWADDTTLDLLQRFVALGFPQNTLLVATTRPDARLDALDVERVTLNPLSREALHFIAQHLDADLAEADLDLLVDRSDGIPLYMEQMVLSSPEDTSIPATLTELFQGRLDQTGPAKSLAQFGASFGRSFPLDLAEAAVSRLGELAPSDPMIPFAGRLDALADDLANVGLVDFEAEGVVRFRHALLRDAAYESQLMSERPERHHAIAEALDASGDALDVLLPSRVAFHFEQAGLPLEAIPRWLVAGDRQAAAGESALAIRQFQRVENLLSQVDPAYGKPFELAACMRIATLTAGQAGYAAPTVDELYQRSLAICDELADVTDMSFGLVATLLGLWTYHCMSGRLDEAAAVSDRLESLTEKSHFPGGTGSVQANRGVEAFIRGDLATAHRLLSASVESYSGDLDLTTWPLPNDGLCGALAVLALVAELRGDADEAERRRAESIARADTLPYPLGPFSRTFAKAYEAWSAYLAGDYERCTAAATETVTVAERHGFAEWQLMGAVHLTGGQLLAGHHEVVINEMTPLLQLIEGLGAHAPLASFWATVAAAHAGLEQWDEATTAVETGMRFVESVGHHLATPALLGVQARIAAASGDHAGASEALDAGLRSATSNENRLAEQSLLGIAQELGVSIGQDPQEVST